MNDLKTEDEVRTALAAATSSRGSLTAWCNRYGLHHGNVSEMRSGIKPITEPVANALGFLRIVRFKKTRAER
jgi:hypothetical protein